jgi:hypothetical protein
MEVIQHIEIGAGGVSQINLTGIPQNYTHLQLLISIRTSYGTSNASMGLYLNGNSQGHTSRVVVGTGSAISTFTVSNRPYDFWVNGATSTASLFGATAVIIPNYAGSTKKTLATRTVASDNSTSAIVGFTGAETDMTSAISSINIIPDSASTIQEHSTVTLYGIAGGSDGTTTIS